MFPLHIKQTFETLTLTAGTATAVNEVVYPFIEVTQPVISYTTMVLAMIVGGLKLAEEMGWRNRRGTKDDKGVDDNK